ncbi:MAG: hypothetical protein KJ077_19190 [Anaerolineae bacterium]|nr:hypothetical protein [Anaerolineae bacterium]
MTQIGVANILLAKDKWGYVELPSMDRCRIITHLGRYLSVKLEACA